MSETLSLHELFPVIREVLASGEEYSFIPHGKSMLPMLIGGADRVTLLSPPETLRRGDLPFYRRNNGQLVIHRVVRVLPDGYVMRGDGQFRNEPGVRHDQIIGVVTAFTHRGRPYRVTDLSYRIYAALWPRSYFIRRFTLHFYRKAIDKWLKK